jgi:hypothetical protein
MASTETRLATLEADFRNEHERVEALKAEIVLLEKRISYYDRMALKWGSVSIGALTIGAFGVMGFDKAKDKIINWFMP